jgi:hypothetical protein
MRGDVRELTRKLPDVEILPERAVFLALGAQSCLVPRHRKVTQRAKRPSVNKSIWNGGNVFNGPEPRMPTHHPSHHIRDCHIIPHHATLFFIMEGTGR